jgi:hypothetical protein
MNLLRTAVPNRLSVNGLRQGGRRGGRVGVRQKKPFATTLLRARAPVASNARVQCPDPMPAPNAKEPLDSPDRNRLVAIGQSK